MSWDNARKRTGNLTVNKSTFTWMVGVYYTDYNKNQRLKRFMIKIKRKLKLRHISIIDEREKQSLMQYKMFEDVLLDIK